MESLGITMIPTIMERKKQNLGDLIIDENGDIDMEEESESEFEMDDEVLPLKNKHQGKKQKGNLRESMRKK